MLCSVELPLKYLSLSIEFDYDFIIASTCLEHPKYLEYFEHIRQPRFTILDNGAFETGEAISDEQYIELARRLKPNVLVIPDVYKDPRTTLIRFTRFIEIWQQAPIEGVSLMGVVHTDNDASWIEYLTNLYLIDAQWIGIPYATGLDRFQLIKKHPEWENVHVLGISHLSEALALLELPNVKSIDSSLPVKATMENKELFQAMAASIYASPAETTLDEALLQRNLQQFAKFCHGACKIN